MPLRRVGEQIIELILPRNPADIFIPTVPDHGALGVSLILRLGLHLRPVDKPGRRPILPRRMIFVTMLLLRQTPALTGHIIPHPAAAVFHYRPQASAKMRPPRGHTGIVHGRPIEIHQFRQSIRHSRIHPLPGRRLDQKRHPGKTILKGTLSLLRQPVISGKIPVIAEEKDRTVIINSCILKPLTEPLKQHIHLAAHSQIDCPQFIPGLRRISLQVLISPNGIQHPGLARTFLRQHPGRQPFPVNSGKIRLLHLIGHVGQHQSQKQTQRLLVRIFPDKPYCLVHRLIVTAVISALFIQAKPAAIVRIQLPVAFYRPRSRRHIPAVENRIRIALGPPCHLAGKQIISGIHPHIIPILPQLREQILLPRMQQIAHGPVPLHMGI